MIVAVVGQEQLETDIKLRRGESGGEEEELEFSSVGWKIDIININ